MWSEVRCLLGAGVLGDSLGSLRDSMLGQLSGQQEPDSSLDLPGGDGGPLVVVGELTGLSSSNTAEQIIHKGVHDAHGLGGDTSVRVHLLQHLVDVDGIGLLPLSLPLLLVSLGNLLGSLARLGSSLSRGLGWHVGVLGCTVELIPGPLTDSLLYPFSGGAGDAIMDPEEPIGEKRAKGYGAARSYEGDINGGSGSIESVNYYSSLQLLHHVWTWKGWKGEGKGQV